MSFPLNVKEDALVNAARRCCLCRRYKGVGVEVHHIIQVADGGANELDNAIVLCFDCHCAAGHYNPRHPRGSKYRPDELIRHRDRWNKSVEEAGKQPLGEDEFSGYYSRHLICLDINATRDLIKLNKDEIPFRYDYIMENDVLRFMAGVLDDDLPFAWADSSDLTGHYWGDGAYKSLEDFYEQHPEFKGQRSRPLVDEDIMDKGLVPSKTIRKIVDSGFNPAELGNVRVQEYGCGEGPTYFVEMRRPLFVFAELRNTSAESIRLSGLIVRNDHDLAYVQKFNTWEDGELSLIPYANLSLEPGEVLLVPECTLLSSISHDSMETEFQELSGERMEQNEIIGFRSSTIEDDFYRFGPVLKLEGFDLEVGHEIKSVPIHKFTPSKCYVYYRAWMCGSCPHLYVFDNHGSWRYLGEILSEYGGENSGREEIFIPEGISKIHIVETDFETSHIEEIEFNGKSLIKSPFLMTQGDSIELEIHGEGTLCVVGRYQARIERPRNYLQLRQKISLRHAYEVANFSLANESKAMLHIEH